MKYSCLLCGLVGAATLLAAPGAAPRDPAVAAPTSDVQDLVYLGGPRPLLVRLHIQIDGKPIAAAWDAYLDALFAYLDRNGDGVLSQEEAAHAPRAEFLRQVFQRDWQALARDQLLRPVGLVFSQPNTVAFADLQPVDGKVTRAQLAAYYRRALGPSGPCPVTMLFDRHAGARAGEVSDLLFQVLDRNKDGKLSQEELAMAGAALRQFDINDDDAVSMEELAPQKSFIPLTVRFPQSVPAASLAAGFFLVEAGEPSPALAAQLLNVYGKAKDQKLRRADLGLDQEAFDRLDADRDGALDAGELARFALILSPDAEFIIRLGTRGSQEAPVAVVPRAAQGQALLTAVNQTASGLTCVLGADQFDLRRDAQGPSLKFNERESYLRLFQDADAEHQGFIDKEDLKDPKLQQLCKLWPLAGDKLTEKELNTFFDLHAHLLTSQVTLTIAEPGRALFDLLDARRNGRLSFHELRVAWQRLKVWDREGKGFLSRADLPKQLRLTVRQGPFDYETIRHATMNGMASPDTLPAPVPTRGPLWFRKMDRNGDGVVSLREFLGSPEEFKRLDLNGDGVIDLEEAEKADGLLRR